MDTDLSKVGAGSDRTGGAGRPVVDQDGRADGQIARHRRETAGCWPGVSVHQTQP